MPASSAITRAQTGAPAPVADGRDAERGQRDESAGEMVESRRAGLGLEEVVVDEVEADEAGGEREEAALAAESEFARREEGR